jgi:PTS system nitrogen regulatory IIA component
MELSDLITPECIDYGYSPGSKKRALEKISDLVVAGHPAFTTAEVFESLVARERLGSTGIGHGVAIPHGRLKGDFKPVAAFLRLSESIDFDALDNAPVDLLFALLVPEDSTEEHLQILAQLAEMFSDKDFCQKLRDTESIEELRKLFSEWKTSTTRS